MTRFVRFSISALSYTLSYCGFILLAGHEHVFSSKFLGFDFSFVIALVSRTFSYSQDLYRRYSSSKATEIHSSGTITLYFLWLCF